LQIYGVHMISLSSFLCFRSRWFSEQNAVSPRNFTAEFIHKPHFNIILQVWSVIFEGNGFKEIFPTNILCWYLFSTPIVLLPVVVVVVLVMYVDRRVVVLGYTFFHNPLCSVSSIPSHPPFFPGSHWTTDITAYISSVYCIWSSHVRITKLGRILQYFFCILYGIPRALTAYIQRRMGWLLWKTREGAVVKYRPSNEQDDRSWWKAVSSSIPQLGKHYGLIVQCHCQLYSLRSVFRCLNFKFLFQNKVHLSRFMKSNFSIRSI